MREKKRKIMTQLKLHKEIRDFLEEGIQNANKEVLRGLLVGDSPDLNYFDARDYFFHNADYTWLAWLYERGFLDILKEPAQNPTSFSYRTPEVSYLVRMASVAEAQELVAEIVLDTPIAKETFNPEVVDQFFWICTKLTAEHLVKIIPKIEKDGWLRLMADVGYDSARYAFDDIFKILTSAGKFDEAILLAQEILSVATKVEKGPVPEDMVGQNAWANKQKIFCCNNIADTGVFGILGDFPAKQNIQVLTLLINKLSEIIKLGDRNPTGFFEYDNVPFSLYGNHFFEVKRPQMRREFGSHDDIDALFTIINWFTNSIITENADPKDMRQAWEVIETLPDAAVTYKIKLFATTRCPAVFSEELRSLLFKLFETKFDKKNIYQVLNGTEYYEALRDSFGVVDWKHDYTKELFPFFTKLIQGTNVADDKKLFQIELRYICSTIQKYLTPAEVSACVDLTGKELIQNFDPATIRSGVVTGGTVVHEPPITTEELDKISLSDLIEKLKSEWSPEQIEEKENWEPNQLVKFDVRGLGDYLTARVQNNLAEAITFAPQFFDSKNIHSHYTASYFEGVRNVLKEKGSTGVDLSHLLAVLKIIREQGIVADLKEENGRRLESWTWVYDVLAEVVGALITEKSLSAQEFKNHRIELLETIEFLFNHPDPALANEDEQIERVTDDKKKNKNVTSFDPISIAINSVRGRAFEVFVNFIYRDNKINGEAPYLSGEVKELYQKLLEKENSRAIMSMFGRYFSVIYFRDEGFVIPLLDKIFPKGAGKEELYRAAWGGYLTTNLFTEIFNDENFQPLYQRWLTEGVRKDEFESYERDADKGIATHLALAYIYFDDFTVKSELFLTIWKNEVPQTTKKEFISFIGNVIYGRAGDLTEKQALKLEKLWDWALDNLKTKELFKNFGTWVAPELFKDDKDGIDGLLTRLNKTLIKSAGELNIDYKLAEYAKLFSEKNPDLFLDIVENHFLQKLKNKTHENPLWIESGWKEAFQNVYKNADATLKAKTEKIINDLIYYGGREFWPLEEVTISKKSVT